MMTNAQQNSESLNRHLQPEVLSHDTIIELLPAFAIGALDREESTLVQRYLVNHPELNGKLVEYLQLDEALLYSSVPTIAPEAIARRLESLAQTAEQTSVQKQAPSSALVNSQPHNGNIRNWWQTFMGWGTGARWAAGLAILALVIAASLYTLRQLDTIRQMQLELRQQVVRQDTALSVLAMEEPQRVEIVHGEGEDEMEASIVWGHDFDVAILYVENFPQLAPNKVYQLWLTERDKVTSFGLFTVNSFGGGSLLIDLPQSFEHYDGLSITSEPVTGSKTPTPFPIIGGKF